jgi:hypothetical protein
VRTFPKDKNMEQRKRKDWLGYSLSNIQLLGRYSSGILEASLNLLLDSTSGFPVDIDQRMFE